MIRIFRIADGRHPVWDGAGAALFGGRWNSVGRPVIYGSLTYACAMLEILAHAGIGRVPRAHRCVMTDVPDGVSVERRGADALPDGWDAEDSVSARAFGDRWLDERRSAILVVPSVIARLDWNALVNPRHPDAARLRPSSPEAVVWDRRLFECGRNP
jgi:RES domain-containing protein